MSKSKISVKNVEHSNNGGNTIVKVTKKQKIQIKYDTSQLEEGFYTTFLGIYSPSEMDTANVLQMEVTTEKEVNMNLNLLLSKNANIKLKEDSYVLFQPVNSEETWILSIEDGTFCLPENVTGTLTLPLKNLEKSKNTKIETIGFIFVLPENSSTGLTLSNLKFLKDNFVAQSMGSYCILQGEARPEIPTIGEYVYNYSLITENPGIQDVKFSLMAPCPGVNMSEDGIMTITSDAECEELTIQAQIDSNVLFHDTVNLVHPWYVDQDMPMFYLPTETNVTKYSQKDESIFYQYSTSTRAAIVVVFLVFIAFYFVNIKKKKDN